MATIADEISGTEYYQYAQNVVSGNIVTGKLIKLACQRFLDDCQRDDLYFDKKKVDKFFKFCSLFRHYKTTDCDSLGKNFVLEPWQQWVMSNLIGFYYKATGKRRFNSAMLCLSRKQGKTALAAVICLWFLLDEAGSSVGLAANSRSQAALAFEFVSKFASQIDPKQKNLRRYRSTIKCDANSGELKVFAADAQRLDGENLSFALIDEYHAAKDNSVYAVLRSSMTSRPNPLILVITTVGFNLTGPMKKMYDVDIEILHGIKQDDNRFSAIYQMDEGDDWEDEDNWIKHSPNLGVSVSYDNLRKAKQEALNNPATLNETLTKNWNVWCSVTECWIPDTYILNCMTQKLNLDDFKECECYVGVDLSCVSDMTAVSYLLKKEDDERYYYYTDYYLPESCLVESPNRELYKEWVSSKQLKLTPGNVVDYDYITNDIMLNYNRFNLQKIGYDQFNATSWAIKCTELGLPLQPYSQSIGNFNKPTKDFERQIRCREAVIDRNEITLWMFRNVSIKQDYNGNAKPVKVFADKKIDGIISMVEALGIYLSVPHYSGSIMTI